MIFGRYKLLVQKREDLYSLLGAVKDSDQDPEIIYLEINNIICELNSTDEQIHREIAAIALKLIAATLILSTIIFTLIKLL